MSETAERDRIRDLLEGQGQVILEGSVNYPAAASFSYTTSADKYMVTVTKVGPGTVSDSSPKSSATSTSVDDVKNEDQPESKPESKLEPKSDSKPKTEPKLEPKSGIESQPKPESELAKSVTSSTSSVKQPEPVKPSTSTENSETVNFEKPGARSVRPSRKIE